MRTAPRGWTRIAEMPDHDLNTLLGWRGRTLLDRRHEKIGKIGDLYLDEETDRPAYAGVRTGLLGRRESIVPLDGIAEQDDELVADYDAELIRDAPAVDPDEVLDEAEQARLARHYHASIPSPEAEDAGGEDAERGTGEGPGMIRSEEEVVTGTTEMRPAERVKLRKVLVTDHVKKTVPVRREEIRLETDSPREGKIERVEGPGDE
jgi:PRC-barrel domain protein